jgi:hypothetical protein
MPRYRIEYDSRGRVSDRDAYHVTVAVWRERDYLGLFQTWVSGIELMAAGPSSFSISADRYWRCVAEQLAEEVERHVRDRRLRTEWSIEVVNVPSNLVEVAQRARRLGSPEVLREGGELRTFDA